jgi:hypothetical protein
MLVLHPSKPEHVLILFIAGDQLDLCIHHGTGDVFPISASVGDGTHLFDELLYHVSDLKIE